MALVAACDPYMAKSQAIDTIILSPSVLQVLDMRNLRSYRMKQDDFFSAFKAGGDQLDGEAQGQRRSCKAMLKVKDFPPTAHFAKVLPRHCQVQPKAAARL